MIDCAGAVERDLAQRYLAGALPHDEVEAFEAHFFGCRSCWEDVRRGSKLRTVLGKPAVALAAPPARRVRTWLPLAAAAAIAFVAFGVFQLSRRNAPQAAIRGIAADVLDLQVAAGPEGSIELAWPPHADAARYAVQVLSSDETRVWKTETSEPRLRIGPGVLPVREGKQALRVEVEAFDSMGQPVAKSAPKPLPKP